MEIEPGMVVWIGWCPDHCVSEPDLKKARGTQCTILGRGPGWYCGICALCNQDDRWWSLSHPEVPGNVVACGCILIPVPPEKQSVDQTSDIEIPVSVD